MRRLAIVNRGEAAVRCIRTIKSLRAHEGSDLEVVALFTDVDRDAPFVRHADLAMRLPARATPVASYLDHDAVIDVLRQVGADAVWPGWGFVAESPAFVDKLAAAGITFLGPSAESMRALGDKIASKLLADGEGIPTIPWSGDVVATVEQAADVAAQLGAPFVIKASAGGGGRGIRLVESPEGLAAAFASAASEARSAFGDDRLFLERCISSGRHIEVQIAADTHGFVRALGCRDCSVQRRHQKVIEEAPPPGIAPAVIDAMQRDAERIASAVGYCGVGTVEFLLDGEQHYFLEVNPRLQVEHGITEEITGLDLVELQIRIARGERLGGLTVTSEGHCIEARVCAEDPDAGFLPAPGRIARFDPALGPNVRIDTGVVVGSVVPPAFDSLIAKVIGRGATREEARARLVAALRDFDLVIEGGATNKSYLLELLDAEPFKAGGVDTRWLDRWGATRAGRAPFAREALVLAAILAYRAHYRSERRNFFANTSNITLDEIPPPDGREVDLQHGGETYRLRVYSVGSLRYRVHLDGRVVSARYGSSGEHVSRIVIAGRYLRATHDVGEASILVEIEGSAHRFGRQTAGEVRAATPSSVVSLDVEVGDHVEVGRVLGLLEAMKMEIGFTAPVTGTVSEIRVRRGQQVAVGELLLVIDPERDGDDANAVSRRLDLPEEEDPLAPLFTRTDDGQLGGPDLEAAVQAPVERRASAVAALIEEIDRSLLGFDVHKPRLDHLLNLLEAPLPSGLDSALLAELAAIRHQLVVFADVERLFSRARRVAEGGTLGPSNNARLRLYVRRIAAGGAGIAPDFLDMLKAALRHYGVESLDFGDDLERAVLRMFTAERDPGQRRRLVMALLRQVLAIVDAGVDLSGDRALHDALERIAGLRGEVSNALADTAIELQDRVFRAPSRTREAQQLSDRLDDWLATSEDDAAPPSPPAEVLDDLAVAAPGQFERVATWLAGEDRWRQMIALGAYVRRLYAPQRPELHRSELIEGRWIDRARYDGRAVLAALCEPGEIEGGLSVLATASELETTSAIEIVTVAPPERRRELVETLAAALARAPQVRHVTLSILAGGAQGAIHETFVRDAGGDFAHALLHGIHPAAAARVDLHRYRNFRLERLWGPDDVYCFHARAVEDPEDERMFVLADVRGKPPVEGVSAELFIPIFERAFQDATRALRLHLGTRDPRRSLTWNRVVMHLAHPLQLDRATAQQLARKLLSNVRHLGVEKTIVRLKLINADRPQDPARELEVVGSDVASSRLELSWRRPRSQPLVPASPYERRVATARRHGLVYPYEIVRMLTHGDEARERAVETSTTDARPVLPVGRFEEYDIAPDGDRTVAVSVADREPGRNTCAIVFGLITTPTEKIPEGMRRVLILSDSTEGMGALAAPECDRVVAAIDLAERLGVPVEWIPVSAGAKIAMDSGTENLDATAKVVRRIVTFTQAGGVMHVIVTGVNVGAQSYWDALSTMLMHTKGVLIMTPGASMVLTGRAALAASGSVSADDELAIGGHERIMGPNGQAQYFAPDLLAAYEVLYQHYDCTYVVPGERVPRRRQTRDLPSRDVRDSAYETKDGDATLRTVGDIFDETANPGRKRPFEMRALLGAIIDQDSGWLERWGSQVGAETAIVWDAHLGGHPVCMIGIESRNVPRIGYRPLDGPESWNGGTLFPQSSKKVARAISSASGNRPVVVLANLSGFDGSPESMRRLQLEYGAEIARAVVNFEGPLLFLVVSRYHGGAYVVFSRMLNEGLRALAVEGSYASVIGGGPAATVVFGREVRARVAADPRIVELREKLKGAPTADARAEFDRLRHDITLEKRAEVAAEYDAIHTVERAMQVGSLEQLVSAAEIRPHLIRLLDDASG